MADEAKQPVEDKSMIEKANRLAAEARVSFPVAFDVNTREATTLQGQQLAEAVAKGTASFRSDAAVPVIAPDGKAGTVPAGNVRRALAAGFRIDDPNNMAARQMVKEHPTWSTIAAGLHAGSEGFLGIPEALAKGINPDLDNPVVDAISAKATAANPKVSTVSRVAAEALPYATGIGEVGGIAKGAEALVTGEKALQVAKAARVLEATTAAAKAAEIPLVDASAGLKTAVEGADAMGARAPTISELFTDAKRGVYLKESALNAAEKFGEVAKAPINIPAAVDAGTKALAKAGLTAMADETPTLARQFAGAAVKHGVEGALANSPEAARHLFEGDPDKAAESLLWGFGAGAVFGTAGKGVGLAVGKTLSAGERYAAARMVQLSSEGGAEMAAGALGKLVEKGVKSAAAGIGQASHIPGAGLAGWVLSKGLAETAGGLAKQAGERWLESGTGQVATKWLKELAEQPLERGFGKGIMEQGVSAMGQKLAHVPGVLAGMSGRELTHRTEEKEREKVSNEEAGRIGALAQQLASSPQALLDATSHVASTLDHSPSTAQVALRTQGKLANMVQYVADNAPKSARPPAPFEPIRWQPSQLELASLARKLEVVYDPFVVISRMADGTLTRDHVDALNALYPKTADEIRKAVLSTAAMPGAPKLTMEQRQKIGLLMGAPIDPLDTPEATRQLQAAFAQQPQAGGPPVGAGKPAKRGPGRPPKVSYDKLPSYGTDVQNIQFTGTRRGR